MRCCANNVRALFGVVEFTIDATDNGFSGAEMSENQKVKFAQRYYLRELRGSRQMQNSNSRQLPILREILLGPVEARSKRPNIASQFPYLLKNFSYERFSRRGNRKYWCKCMPGGHGVIVYQLNVAPLACFWRSQKVSILKSAPF